MLTTPEKTQISLESLIQNPKISVVVKWMRNANVTREQRKYLPLVAHSVSSIALNGGTRFKTAGDLVDSIDPNLAGIPMELNVLARESNYNLNREIMNVGIVELNKLLGVLQGVTTEDMSNLEQLVIFAGQPGGIEEIYDNVAKSTNASIPSYITNSKLVHVEKVTIDANTEAELTRLDGLVSEVHIFSLFPQLPSDGIPSALKGLEVQRNEIGEYYNFAEIGLYRFNIERFTMMEKVAILREFTLVNTRAGAEALISSIAGRQSQNEVAAAVKGKTLMGTILSAIANRNESKQKIPTSETSNSKVYEGVIILPLVAESNFLTKLKSSIDKVRNLVSNQINLIKARLGFEFTNEFDIAKKKVVTIRDLATSIKNGIKDNSLISVIFDRTKQAEELVGMFDRQVRETEYLRGTSNPLEGYKNQLDEIATKLNMPINLEDLEAKAESGNYIVVRVRTSNRVLENTLIDGNLVNDELSKIYRRVQAAISG